MKRIIQILLLVVVAGPLWSQNQFHHGLYMMHQPYINTASMGSYEHLTVSAMYKAQWTGIEGAPRIGAFNLVKPFANNAIGLTVQNDQVYINNHTQIAGSYSHTFTLAEGHKLAMGISGVLNLMSADLSRVGLVQQGDPTFTFNTQQFLVPNGRFGAYYFKNNFYAGFALPNLLQNRVVFDNVLQGSAQFNSKDVHWYAHSGLSHPIDEKTMFNGSILLKNVHGAPMQLDVNARVEFNKVFGVGASYRTSNELLGILTCRITPDLQLGYAYEYNNGALGTVSSGSHEIMVIYRILPPVEPVISVPRF